MFFLTIQQKSQLKNNRRNRQSEQIEDNFLLKKKPDKTDNKYKKTLLLDILIKTNSRLQ